MLRAEDKMVQYGAIHGLGHGGKALRHPTIGAARARVAARVIMCEQQPNTPMQNGIGDDLAKREIRTALVAFVTRQVQAPRLAVQMGNEQIFPARVAILQASGEKRFRRIGIGNLQGGFGTLKLHDLS